MKKKLSVIIISVLVLVLSVSIFFIASYHHESVKQEDLYTSLVEQVKESKEEAVITKQEKYSTERKLVPEYVDLYQQNKDMIGWIKIEDTSIDYPVMQSIENPNFYLEHNFDKSYTAYGCPYVQENCNVLKPSDNIIIYGHNMRDGSMFADLLNYSNKNFWEQHKKISFDTLTANHEYEIIAVFKTKVYTENDSFEYYNFTDAGSKEDFNAFISKCRELSLYDTGIVICTEPRGGDLKC